MSEIDSRADVVGGHHRAVMNVGEESDAQAVERRRQSGYGKRGFGGAEMMALVRDAVGAGSGDGADRPSRRTPLIAARRVRSIRRLYSSG